MLRFGRDLQHLQPQLATQLRDRKLAHIERTGAAVVATGNVGCIMQLRAGGSLPVVHTVELLDWACGGPRPAAAAARLAQALVARHRALGAARELAALRQVF